MSYLTDLFPNDKIMLDTGESVVTIQVKKRTGLKVRIAIDAAKSIKISKIEAGLEREFLGNKD